MVAQVVQPAGKAMSPAASWLIGVAFFVAIAHASYHEVTSTTCEEQTPVRYTIIGPDRCKIAATALYSQTFGNPTLYGATGCDIGLDDGVDYGYCNGGSNSKPAGCSKRTSNDGLYSHTGLSSYRCSSSYKCICSSTP